MIEQMSSKGLVYVSKEEHPVTFVFKMYSREQSSRPQKSYTLEPNNASTRCGNLFKAKFE